ncbi:helix-turn-helix domain-containing protein [[Clostridium] fimetarium]|uniref:DNA-binding transcriptional regulator, XRE family n=1 Tax=[Clostridium] fimetarium TaxID=99656 RepID=A0A1I0QWC4_9FIRM|nr:helix-turn-helix transcriptional regulator [[Clostridium] fimetarium]SEW31796.1 DNA-binding transcriptional regulator, XRE family [[Clostridium] fimetarium]
MISYEPLWKTMKKKGVTSYKLIYQYKVSSNTIRRMKKQKNVTLNTINDLCNILQCNVSEVIEFTPDEEIEEKE